MRSSITDRLNGIVKLLQTSEAPLSRSAINHNMVSPRGWNINEITAALNNLCTMQKIIKTTGSDGQIYYKMHPSHIIHETNVEKKMRQDGISITALCKAIGITPLAFKTAKKQYTPWVASQIAAHLGLDLRTAFGTKYADVDKLNSMGAFNPRSKNEDKAS